MEQSQQVVNTTNLQVNTEVQPQTVLDNQPKYAGFWVRVAAAAVDFIVFSISIGLIPVFYFAFKTQILENSALKFLIVLLLFIPLLYPLVVPVFFVFRFGATPGKMFFGLKITKNGGLTPGLKTAIVREILGKFVSRLILGLGYLWVIFDKEKQALHDKLAGTHVVQVKPLTAIKKFLVIVFALMYFLVILFLAGLLSILNRSLNGLNNTSYTQQGFANGGLLSTIMGIDPARQFAQANNTQRSSNVHAIANAISQYRNDNSGSVPPGIDTTVRTITDSGAPLTVDLCAALVPTYFADIPFDPSIGSENPKYVVCTEPGADYNSGYTVVLDPVSNKITVSASGAELGETISATEPSYGADQTNSTNISTQKDDVRIKDDIDVISSELMDYYVAKNTFPAGLYI